MFYIIVTEQDHQESFVGYSILPVRSETSVPSGRMAQATKRWKLWGWGYQPLECGPYRGESWFDGDFLHDFSSVFYLLIMYEGSVIVIVSCGFETCVFFFHLDPWRNVFGDYVPMKPPPRSSGDPNPAQLILARLASPSTVVLVSSSFFTVHLPKAGVWASISGKCWVHPGFMYLLPPIYSSNNDWLHRHSIHEISKSCLRRWSESDQRTGMMSLCGLGVKNLWTGMLCVHFSLEIKTKILQVRKDDGNIITCLRCVSKVAQSLDTSNLIASTIWPWVIQRSENWSIFCVSSDFEFGVP